MLDKDVTKKYFSYLKFSFTHFLISSSIALFLYFVFYYAFAFAINPLGEGAIFLTALLVPILLVIGIGCIILGTIYSTRYLSEKSSGLNYKIVAAISSVFFIIALSYTYLAFFIDSIRLGAIFANTYEYVKVIDYRLKSAISLGGTEALFEIVRDLTYKKFEYTNHGISVFRDYIFPDLVYVLSFSLSSLYFLKGQFSIILLKDETMRDVPKKNRPALFLLIPVFAFFVYIFGFVLNPAFKYVAINYRYNEPTGFIRPIFTSLENCNSWTNKKLDKINSDSLADVFHGSYSCESLLDYGE